MESKYAIETVIAASKLFALQYIYWNVSIGKSL